MYGIQNKGNRYYKRQFQNNNDKILKEYITTIHSNIKYIKNTNIKKENEDDLQEICNKTISTITEAYHIVSKNSIENKREILNFLNESSQLCKNILWYRKVKTHKEEFQVVNKMKNICNDIEKSNSELYNNITEKINKDKDIDKNNILDEVKNLSSMIENQSKLYEKLDNKLNCCMQSLACSMELLSYNVEKSKFIHDDLKKNNMITAKISMDNENFNQKMLEFSDNNSISDSDITDIQDIKNMLLEADNSYFSKTGENKTVESDKNYNKNTLVHYLLHTVLKNSKDILCQIIPQMNMWQRQKVFTTIMKLVEDRVDNCSDKLNCVINEFNNTNDVNLSDTLKKVFNTDSLKITKEDIKNASWEENSSSDSDSDSDSDMSLKKVQKKDKKEILEEIMNELNNKKDIQIKKK